MPPDALPPAGPVTREMPVYQADQPPVEGPGRPPVEFPGHRPPGPAADRARGRDEGDAAEIEAWQKSQERTKRRAKLRANQRKAREIQRQRSAGSPIGAIDPLPQQDQGFAPPSVAGRGQVDRPDRRMALVAGGVLLVGIVAVVGYLFTGLSLGTEEDTAGGASRSDGGDQPSLNVGADVGPRSIDDLALSTVQLVGLDDDLQPECAGSGVIVRADGMILTNAHVVTSEGECSFTSIGVGVTVDSSSPAELRYRAVVLAVDPTTDLAVLRIAGMLDPESGAEPPSSFPAAPLGDSDTIDLGDDLRILGYPVIGGETITLTRGSVSGFTAQAGLGTRALIKTDATIAAGNSGGMAVDAAGRVVGIPTKARASADGPAIDCRPLADTNADGEVDSTDNCVPVGGFLNGIRPINLALALLGTATTAEPIGPVVLPEIELDFDLAAVTMTNPRFSLGQRANAPVEVVTTAEAGIAELCFFVDWTGIPPGTTWDGAWFVNGQLEPGLGHSGETWALAEEGRNFWLCAQEGKPEGLPAGVYEIGFFLDGSLVFAEGIVLTSEPVDVVEVIWTNATETDICSLAVNPFSDSGQVGLDELPVDDVIRPGESRSMSLPLGSVVVEAYDCEDQPIADNFGGLPISGPATFLIGL